MKVASTTSHSYTFYSIKTHTEFHTYFNITDIKMNDIGDKCL